MTAITKRIYVGGLHPEVTEAEIHERFSKYGTIQSPVDIKHKKQPEGFPEKTFAYFNFSTTEDQLQKCFSLFNKAKWKGQVLKLQIAKSDFMARLKEERENNFIFPESNKTKRKSFNAPLEGIAGVKDFVMTGAVPGTPVTEEKTWIVGKYGRVLPVVHIRNKDRSRSIKVDPSKFCHFVKKIKDNPILDADLSKDVDHLTWELEEKDTDIVRKRKGNFPKWVSKVKKPKKMPETKSQEALRRDTLKHQDIVDDDFEVVAMNTSSQGRVYFSEDSSEDETDYRAMMEMSKMTLTSCKDQASKCPSSAKEVPSKSLNSNDKSLKTIQKESQDMLPKENESLEYGFDLKHKLDSQLVKSRDQKKIPDITFEGNSLSVIGVPSIDDLDTTRSVNQLYSCTHMSSAKPKLQPFGGTKKLYTIDMQSEGTKSVYASSIESWIGKNSDSGLNLKSKSVKGTSVSLADTAHVISNTKPKLQPFGGTIQLYANELTSSSEIPKEVYSSDNSISQASVPLWKSKNENSKDHDVLHLVVSGQHKNTAAIKDDSDNESLSSANTDILIASAKKIKAQTSQVMFDELLPVKNRINDEYFGGFTDKILEPNNEKIATDGYYGDDEDDDDFEDDFEKLVKNALLNDSYQTGQSNTCEKKQSDVVHRTLLTLNKSKHSDDSDSTSDFENISQEKDKVPESSSTKKDKREDEKKKKETHLKEKEKSKIDFDKNKTKLEKPLNSKDIKKDSYNGGKCSKYDKQESDNKKEKQTDTNKKRLDTLKERQKEASSQKSLISQALSAVDKGKLLNKKIVFDSSTDEETVIPCEKTIKPDPSEVSSDSDDDTDDDSEDEDETKEIPQKSAKDKDVKKLFDSSSEDNSSDKEDKNAFRLRPQFEGEEGGKLMALQMRFGNDERFRLDERFHEDETRAVDDEDNEEDEKTKALKVLQEIVGSKVNLADSKEKSRSKKIFRDITTLHYDPESETGKQLEIETTKEEKQKKKTPSKKKDSKAEEKSEDPGLPEVSKERFFEVSDSLTETFKKTKQESTGFSLLAAFGRQEDDDNNDDADISHGETTSLKTGLLSWQRKDVVNSSEESEDDMETENQGKGDVSVNPVIFSRAKTFFFTENDDRISEGVSKFCRHGDLEEIRAKWLEKRPQLVDSYRSKHKRLLRKARALEKDRLHQKRLQRNAKSNL